MGEKDLLAKLTSRFYLTPTLPEETCESIIVCDSKFGNVNLKSQVLILIFS